MPRKDKPPLGRLADADDELDATGVDFKADPVPDSKLPYVAMGGTKAAIERYRKLFGVKPPKRKR